MKRVALLIVCGGLLSLATGCCGGLGRPLGTAYNYPAYGGGYAPVAYQSYQSAPMTSAIATSAVGCNCQ